MKGGKYFLTSIVVRFAEKIAKPRPNLFFFLSGTFIAASINLLTSLIWSEKCIFENILIPISSALLFISGFLSTILAWEIDEVHALAADDVSRSKGELGLVKSKETYIRDRPGTIVIYFVLFVGFAISGLFLIGLELS